MNRAHYRKLLEADLARWLDKGWVGAEGAERIRAELAAEPRAASRLPALFAAIGTICLALAVAAFVAANWEAIPRPAKLAGIAVLLVGAHGFAAAMAARGRKGVADLATMFATLVFVAGMSLVGQMYHLPVDWAGGALLVAIGALTAAWICGSRASLVVAAIAAITWLAFVADPPRPSLPETAIALALLALTAGHVLRRTSFAGRWIVLLQATGVYGWLLAGALEEHLSLSTSDLEFSALFAMAAFGTALAVWGQALSTGEAGSAAAETAKGDGESDLARFAGTAMDYGMLAMVGCVLFALILGFADVLDEGIGGGFAGVWPLALAVLATLAGLAWQGMRVPRARAFQMVAIAVALSLACPLAFLLAPEQGVLLAALVLAALVAISAAGSATERRSWSAAGNLGIAAALLFLLYVTVGSLLGQSVFFLVAGIVLVTVAVIAARRMRRQRDERIAGENS